MTIRQIERLEDVREWRVPATDSLDWSLEVQEALFLDCCGKLGAEAAGDWGLV